MRVRSPTRRPRRGAAVAEMAILLPFLAFLFLVTVDFCRVFHHTQTVQGCAHTAALYASGTARHPSAVTPEEAARQAALADGGHLNPPLRAEDVSVQVADGVATVTVTYRFETLSGFRGVPRLLTIERTARQRVAPRAGDGA